MVTKGKKTKANSKKADDGAWIKDHVKKQEKLKKHQEGLKKKYFKISKELAIISAQLMPNVLSATSFNHERVRYFKFNSNMIYPIDYLKMLVKQKYSDTDPHQCYHTQMLIKLPKGIGGSTLKGKATKVNKARKSNSKKDGRRKKTPQKNNQLPKRKR